MIADFFHKALKTLKRIELGTKCIYLNLLIVCSTYMKIRLTSISFSCVDCSRLCSRFIIAQIYTVSGNEHVPGRRFIAALRFDH